MGEYMMLGLRMTDGICERDFEARFGNTVQDVFGSVIKKLA